MTPDDVYALVTQRSGHTQYMVSWAIGLLVANLFVMLVVVLPASVLFIRDKRARAAQYEQNKRILVMAEKHGELTDEKYKLKAKLIAEEVRHILELKQDVSEVKDKVAGVKEQVDKTAPLIIAAMTADPPSGTAIDPNNPPRRRAGD